MRKYLVLALVLVLTLLVLTPLVRATIPYDGLLGYWKLNGINDVQDYSSNLKDGLIGGGISSTDRFGNSEGSIYYPGNEEGILLNSFSSTSTTYTFSVWVNMESDTSAYIFDSQTGRLMLSYNYEGSIRVFDGAYRNFEVVPIYDRWIHLVMTLNGANSKARLYLDSQFQNEITFVPRQIGGTTRIGSRYEITGSNWYNMKGSIDEFMIYNRVLTDDEIQEIYSRQAPYFLTCSIVTNTSCTGENEIIAYLKNDTAGYNNAHMALANYSSDYPYVVCCNASDVNQSVNTSCDALNSESFLKSFSQTNTHVQNPSVNNYIYDSCLAVTKYSSNFNYRENRCILDETCLLSISNSTNAHVGNCSHYTTQVCANLTFTNNLPEVTSITLAPEGANTTTNLECTFVVEDQDAEDTLSANYFWYKNGELQSGLSETLSPVTNGTQNSVYLLSENTAHFQNWSCAVTPYDSYQYGETNFSNNITIVNTAPSIPTQLTPQNGNTNLTNRNVNFSWSPSTDPDGDEITYVINLTNSYVGGFYENTTNQSYIHSSELSTNDETQGALYYWQIKACDPYGACSDWSQLWNFSVMAVLWIETINGEIDFGQVQIDQTYDTLDPAYDPFLFENYGNVEADLTNITGDDLWATQPLDGTEYVQLKANHSSAQAPYNEAGTKEDWFNVSNGDYSENLISQFDYHTNTKEVLMDLRVKVPTVEDPGSKTTTLTFYWMKS
ncbi:MAG: LamG domain-containing protein [Candidatus Nanoarchaeia archaeon]|nr:LamG domain-containing protein [Candidatus Nanoarchaeia archaeon]